jgi:hypothetical protein
MKNKTVESLVVIFTVGFKKREIGIEELAECSIEELESASSTQIIIMIGRKIKNWVALFPNILFEYFKSKDFELEDTLELLRLMRKTFSHVGFSFVGHKGQMINCWSIPLEEMRYVMGFIGTERSFDNG